MISSWKPLPSGTGNCRVEDEVNEDEEKKKIIEDDDDDADSEDNTGWNLMRRGACLTMKQKIGSICFTYMDGIMKQSIDNKVVKRIRGHGRGWVFSPTDFKDLGSRTAVALALMRYKRGGKIRQIARGLYDYPRIDKDLGVLAPSIDQIKAALELRDAVRLQPSGAYAANLLGLNNQVPMQLVFLTDGPERKLQVGKRTIQLKHTTPRNMATAGRISGTVIQALRWLGKPNVDDHVIALLNDRLNSNDMTQLSKDIRYAPIWIAQIIRIITSRGEF